MIKHDLTHGIIYDEETNACWRYEDGRYLKMCPVCYGRLVIPWPTTKVYCSAQCRKTAAARRYRAKKAGS
jgi:hypothetical protein